MTCQDDTNCNPPAPVMPRCDVALPDGTFTNATITVSGGCITQVATGIPLQYTPDVCCSDVAGGGGGNADPCDCPPGEDGQNATINIGQVFGVAANQPARVVNVGTDTNAVLEFYIPRGATGEDGESLNGITNTTAGIGISGGAVVSLPGAWPPALAFNAVSYPIGAVLSVSQPNSNTGLVDITLDIRPFETTTRNWVTEQITNATTPLANRIATLEAKVAALEVFKASAEARLNACCP